jgi:hypothetical protein
MQTNNILVPEQFGFRQGKFTDNAAFKKTNSVLKFINQKMHVGGIFCDLTEAFDCVNHEILPTKLHYYGIQGTAANWFRSSLTNRKQETEIKSFEKFSSKWGTVKHGILQGSILAPLLFIIHIYDLHPIINMFSELVLFPDDTSVIIWSKNFDDFSAMSSTFLCHMSK